MTKLMLFPFLLILAASFKKADNKEASTFNFLNTDTKFDIAFCKKAISEANWCGYRYKSKRNTIQFETGLKVELYSQNEINETNSNCTLTEYRDFSEDIWRFTPKGKIVHLVSKTKK